MLKEFLTPRKVQMLCKWKKLSNRQLARKAKIPYDDIINEFHYKLSWKVISKQKLSSKILHDFQDKIIWNLYLQHNDLDLNMIKQNIPFSKFRSFILGN